MTKWYDSDNPSTVLRGGGWRLGVVVICVVLFFLAGGVLLWAFGVFTSDIKGQGDAEKTKNSATNRIAAQERFEDLYQDILASDRKLDPAYAAMKAAPDSQVKLTEYTGLVNYCIDVVADYNAEARKFTAEEFRSVDLPQVIDSLAIETDCKPTEEGSFS